MKIVFIKAKLMGLSSPFLPLISFYQFVYSIYKYNVEITFYMLCYNENQMNNEHLTCCLKSVRFYNDPTIISIGLKVDDKI